MEGIKGEHQSLSCAREGDDSRLPSLAYYCTHRTVQTFERVWGRSGCCPVENRRLGRGQCDLQTGSQAFAETALVALVESERHHHTQLCVSLHAAPPFRQANRNRCCPADMAFNTFAVPITKRRHRSAYCFASPSLFRRLPLISLSRTICNALPGTPQRLRGFANWRGLCWLLLLTATKPSGGPGEGREVPLSSMPLAV